MAPGWLWVLQICDWEQRGQEPAQYLLSPAPVRPCAIDCTAGVLLQGWLGGIASPAVGFPLPRGQRQ